MIAVTMNRILAIDYGRKRTGLAATDPLGMIARPLPALHGTPDEALPKIAELCVDRQTEHILLGLPMNMDGSEGPMALETRAWGARLGEVTGLAVEMADERLTSHSAKQHLRGMKKKHRRRDTGLIDSLAAVEILRDWMSAR